MSATITDYFNKASSMNGSYPPVATVTSARSVGGTTLACDSLSGWATDTPVHFSTFKVNSDGTVDTSVQTDWKGIVVGNTITEMTRLAGAADSGHTSGDRVELNPTIGWLNDLVNGILVSHKQNGALKDSSVTTDAMATGAVTEAKVASSAITTNKIADSAITTAKLADSAVTSDKIDFTTMKKWVPDYNNMGSTNLLSSAHTFTVSEVGFVYVFWEGYKPNDATDVSFTVNGSRVARALGENLNSSGARTTSLSAILPVTAGDVVAISRNEGTSTNTKEAFFIPGKWV